MNKLLKNSRNVFYFSKINSIGGVEQYFWYLAQKYPNIEVYYKEGDIKQISRLAELIPTHKYIGGTIVCDKFFCAYNIDILDNVEANDIFYVIHCDYKEAGISPIMHPKINNYIGVSQLVCDSFYELTGTKAELIYNPIVVDKNTQKPLLIVCATRLTKEKGKENIIWLDNELEIAKIKHLFIIFTDDRKEIDSPNIIYASSRLDIDSFLKLGDYVFQPSKTESYGYTVNQALILGVPIIAMDLPIWKELGIKDGEHGYIIDNKIKFDVKKLLNIPKNFNYEPPKDNWGKYLKGKSYYDANKLVNVKPIRDYYDIELQKWVFITDEPFEVKIPRAIYLTSLNLVRLL